MRVLIVASRTRGSYSPFVVEQAQALQQQCVAVDCFGVVGKGIKGYLGALSLLRKKINEFQPDIIHAHYGLSGLLANLQSKVPVVTTYHGSDINVATVRRFSKMAMCLSVWNVFVSQRNVELAKIHKKYSLLPCGIDVVTSFTEGSPQVVKEAMVCNCPVVTVDVGDVKERLEKVQPSAIVERNSQSIAKALHVILEYGERSNGREELLRQGLDNRKVAEKLIQIYNNILNKI